MGFLCLASVFLFFSRKFKEDMHLFKIGNFLSLVKILLKLGPAWPTHVPVGRERNPTICMGNSAGDMVLGILRVCLRHYCKSLKILKHWEKHMGPIDQLEELCQNWCHVCFLGRIWWHAITENFPGCDGCEAWQFQLPSWRHGRMRLGCTLREKLTAGSWKSPVWKGKESSKPSFFLGSKFHV